MKPIHLTILMVLLLAGLGGYVLFFENKPAEVPVDTSQKPKPTLLMTTRKRLQRLELDQNSPSKSASLEQKNGTWLIDGKPADAMRVDTLMTQLENWQAEDLLEPTFPAARASEFGLEPAEMILRLSMTDGQQLQFKIGIKTPTSTGYYLLKAGDPALYLAYVNVPEELAKLIAKPPLAGPSPKPLAPKPSGSTAASPAPRAPIQPAASH